MKSLDESTEGHDEIIAALQHQADQNTKEIEALKLSLTEGSNKGLDAETQDIINSLIQQVASLHGERKENDDLPEQIDALRNQLNESLKKLEEETKDAISANSQQIQLLRSDSDANIDTMKNHQQVSTEYYY
jgi:LPS O-antigen subunit length determinant protein (WzzB/FepE family)